MDLITKIKSVIFFHSIDEESLLEILNEAIDFGIADLECSWDGFEGNISFNDNGSFTIIEWVHVDDYMADMYKEMVFAKNEENSAVFIEPSDCSDEWVDFTVVTTIKIYKDDLLGLLCKN